MTTLRSEIAMALAAPEKDEKQPQVMPTPNVNPAEVDEKDLQPNGKLLTEEQYQAIKEILKNYPSGFRYPKSFFEKIGVHYAIIKGSNDRLYVIYNNGKQVELGKGGSGAVKAAQCYETGGWHAVKTATLKDYKLPAKNQTKLPSYQSMLNELAILEALGKATDNKIIARAPSKKNPSRVKVEILMPYVGGQGFSSFRDKRINHELVLPDIQYLEAVITAFDDYYNNVFLKGYLHRDLKASNLRSGGVVDFGFAVKYDDKSKAHQGKSWCGTEGYIAPEIYEEFLFSEKSEVFAWGAILRMLLFNERIILQERGGLPIFRNYDGTIFRNDTVAMTFVQSMLSVDPAKRPTLAKTKQFLIDLQYVMTRMKRELEVIIANLTGVPSIVSASSPLMMNAPECGAAAAAQKLMKRLNKETVDFSEEDNGICCRNKQLKKFIDLYPQILPTRILEQNKKKFLCFTC